MNHKISHLISILKNDMGLLLSISFGIFLFVLFFQPISFDRFDFNDRLLFVGGFSGIVFLFMALIRIIFHWLDQHTNYIFPSYLSNFLLLTLSALGLTFYVRYVGWVPITFFIVVKLVLISMVAPFVIRVYIMLQDLRAQNQKLTSQIVSMQSNSVVDAERQNIEIVISSENQSERLNILIKDLAFIRSADNYVEVIYKEEEAFKRKLIRNTLKNIETLLKPYNQFVRCHRVCIFNAEYIENLHSKDHKQWLKLKDLDDEIPVSRQYILQVKSLL